MVSAVGLNGTARAVSLGVAVTIPDRVATGLQHHRGAPQAYLAVFDEALVRTYRAFLDRRRATRPEAEYREPTQQEWTEFQQHFQTRKLELSFPPFAGHGGSGVRSSRLVAG
jgi:hypothetical protein